MVNDRPTLRTVDEYGHVEVTWPDPPRPFYKVAHEVIEDVVRWRNEYADMVERGGNRARLGCPQCHGNIMGEGGPPALRCIQCGSGYWDDGADQ